MYMGLKTRHKIARKLQIELAEVSTVKDTIQGYQWIPQELAWKGKDPFPGITVEHV